MRQTFTSKLLVELEEIGRASDPKFSYDGTGSGAVSCVMKWPIRELGPFFDQTREHIKNDDNDIEMLEELDAVAKRRMGDIKQMLQCKNPQISAGYRGHRRTINFITRKAREKWAKAKREMPWLEEGWAFHFDQTCIQDVQTGLRLSAAVESYREVYSGKIHSVLAPQDVTLLRTHMRNVKMRKRVTVNDAAPDVIVDRWFDASSDERWELESAMQEYLMNDVLRQIHSALACQHDRP